MSIEGLGAELSLDLVTLIRKGYVDRGAQHGPLCASATCLTLARVKVFWPVMPGEAYPVYCFQCAAMAKRTLEALGYRYDEQALPQAPEEHAARRSIRFEDHVVVRGDDDAA